MLPADDEPAAVEAAAAAIAEATVSADEQPGDCCKRIRRVPAFRHPTAQFPCVRCTSCRHLLWTLRCVLTAAPQTC